MLGFTGFGRVTLAMLLVATTGRPLLGQTAPAWRETLPGKVEAFDLTPFHSVLVQHKGGLLAIDPGSGKQLWARPDVTDYRLVSASPFGVFTTETGRTVADVETGTDRWQLASLGFSSIKGLVHLPGAGMLLVYGQRGNSPHVLTAARYDTGQTVWTQSALFTGPVVGSKASKVKYRSFLLDSDSTVILDPSEDGLIRLDLRDGHVLWRIDKAQLDCGDEDVDLTAAEGRIFAAYKKKMLAVDQTDGRVLWTRKQGFPTPIFQTAATAYGLLVRGAYNLDSKGRSSWHPFLAMLDPTNGGTRWSNENQKFGGRSAFLAEGDEVTIALESGLATLSLATGATTRTASLPKFEGGESPCCLERTDEGDLRVWSSQNLRLVDRDGKAKYAVYLKAPGASFLTKLAVVALSALATTASYSAAPPGGFYSVYAPSTSVLSGKFKATSAGAREFFYVFTEDTGSQSDRFALVRLDKQSGKDTGRLKFVDRSPSFRLDPLTGCVVVADGESLYGLRFPPPQ